MVIYKLLLILVLILLNGFFVLSEIAIVSARKIRLERRVRQGSRSAQVALKLANSPQKTLSGIQFFITLVSFIAAAYGGTEFSQPLADFFAQYSFLKEYSHFLGVFVIVVITTYFSLVLGELVPKTIALTSPEKTSVRVAYIMQFMGWIAAPVVFILQRSTRAILNLLGYKGNSEPFVTEEELEMMIEQGSEHGVIEEQESQMVKGVFRFGDRKVNSLMTHRNDMTYIEVDATEDEVYALLRTSIHSSFPVCEKGLDKITGIVFIKDIAAQIAETKRIDIKKIMKQPLFVPETMPALELMEKFRETRMHTGFVIDEFGVMEGVVTFHDILEAIVGEMPLESAGTSSVKQRKDGSWLIDGTMQIDEWTAFLGLKDLKEIETGAYNTLGGFMMHHLGRIPTETDVFTFRGYTFEVVDMDGRRVDKVMVKKLEPEEEEDQED